MTEALVLHQTRGLFHVPDELALQMIADCSKRILAATTIPHVKRVITEAEAIQAVTKKFQLSQSIQQNALELRIQAERQLGEITRALPQAPRGGASRPGEIKTKTERLAEHGISKALASRAEKLAEAPKAAVMEAMARTKPPTLSGVVQNLGLSQPWPHRAAAIDRVRELVTLVERLHREQRPPTDDEVASARDSLPKGKGRPRRDRAA